MIRTEMNKIGQTKTKQKGQNIYRKYIKKMEQILTF